MSGNLALQPSGIARSANLVATLDRAQGYAEDQGHHEIALEHLLLAFTEDPDTLQSLAACEVDVERLRNRLAEYLAQSEPGEPPPRVGEPPRPSLALSGLLAEATDAAIDAHRREINSFIVLAALVGSEGSDASRILDEHGFTWDKAIKALQPPITAAETASAAGGRTAPAPDAGRPAEPALASPAPPVADDRDDPLSEEPFDAARADADLAPTPPRPLEINREARFAAPERKPARAARAPVATQSVDDIMASVRRKLGGKPPPARSEPAPDEPAGATRGQASLSEAAAAAPAPVLPPPRAPTPRPAATRAGKHAPVAPHPPLDAIKVKTTTLNELAAEAAAQARPDATPPIAPWPDVGGARRSLRELAAEPVPADLLAPSPEPAPLEPYPQIVEERAARPGPDLAAPYPARPAAPHLDLAPQTARWPATWRLGRPREVRIEIPRGVIEALGSDVSRRQGPGGFSVGAVTLRLRSEGRAFLQDPIAPETQWIENTQGLSTEGSVAWRWILTPRRTGRSAIRVVASLRTLGADGMAVEIALPDTFVPARVRGRLGPKLLWLGWPLAGLLAAAKALELATGNDPIANGVAALLAALGGR